MSPGGFSLQAVPFDNTWVKVLSTDSAQDAPVWKAAQSGTLSWNIVSQIRAAVFSEKLQAGQFLGSEATLSNQFGVSRMAARDALRTLEGLGIVEIRMGAKGGVWISQGNPDRLADALAIHLKLIGVTSGEVFDAQMAIETMAAELAAERRTDEDLAYLGGLIEQLISLKDDLDSFAGATMQFHEGIVQASHSRILLAEFHALMLVLQPVLLPSLTPVAAGRIIRRNEMLLAALQAGDGVAAARVMRERIAHQRATTRA